jgi:hypothetical protein
MDYILFTLFLISIGLILGWSLVYENRWNQLILSFLSVLFLTISPGLLPAIAEPIPVLSALEDSVDLQDQNLCKFEETISVSSTGDMVGGFCVAQGQNGNQSDTDIAQSIRSQMLEGDDVVVRVDNRAVFLSGSVKDEESAKRVIQQIEKVPGVQWVTASLNLNNVSRRTVS